MPSYRVVLKQREQEPDGARVEFSVTADDVDVEDPEHGEPYYNFLKYSGDDATTIAAVAFRDVLFVKS